MVIVLEQGYVSSGVVLRNLRYLLSQPAAGPNGSRATVVINRVLTDPRAGRLEQLREEISHTHPGPIIEIPWDLDLRAEIDAGTYLPSTGYAAAPPVCRSRSSPSSPRTRRTGPPKRSSVCPI
jgi:hypothetical protein